jgi:hypothetical protein
MNTPEKWESIVPPSSSLATRQIVARRASGTVVIAEIVPEKGTTIFEKVANGRLIAAAPDLLAALREIDKALVLHPDRNRGNSKVHYVIHAARAAIAKATTGKDTPTFIEAEKQAAKERDRVYSLSEAVADLTWNLTSDMEAGKVGHIPDSREVIRLCIEWANEFEAKNAGREWDGEYMEAIDAFYTEKIKSL